jgi:hypothetical protein
VETKTLNNDKQISVFCRQRFKKHVFLILQLTELEANPMPMSQNWKLILCRCLKAIR